MSWHSPCMCPLPCAQCCQHLYENKPIDRCIYVPSHLDSFDRRVEWAGGNMEREQPRVVLTDEDGFKVRGEVIHVGRDVGADGSFELILCILEWLDLGKYPAVLTTSQETLQ